MLAGLNLSMMRHCVAGVCGIMPGWCAYIAYVKPHIHRNYHVIYKEYIYQIVQDIFIPGKDMVLSHTYTAYVNTLLRSMYTHIR